MNTPLWTVSFVLAVAMIPRPAAAQVNLSFDGSQVNLTAANESYGNILNLLGRHTGLEMEIPNELKTKRVPLLEIRGLGVKAAVLKIMEGSGFDYFLLARAGRPDTLARLIVVRQIQEDRTADPAQSSGCPSHPQTLCEPQCDTLQPSLGFRSRYRTQAADDQAGRAAKGPSDPPASRPVSGQPALRPNLERPTAESGPTPAGTARAGPLATGGRGAAVRQPQPPCTQSQPPCAQP